MAFFRFKKNRRAARRSGHLTRLAARLLVLCSAGAAFALWLLDPVPMQSLRLAQFDQFQRWQPRPYTPAPVRVVDIDEASLKAYGQWPWPRTRIAQLVQRLHAAGATAIAFDVLLAEPDRTSPKAMAELWQDPQASAFLKGLPDHDELLAGTLQGAGVVLGTYFSDSGAALPAAAPTGSLPKPPYRLINLGTANPAVWLHKFDTAVWPLPVLSASASGLGAINFIPDGDSVVRRVPLLLRLGEQVVPSLSAEALRVANGETNQLVNSTDAGVQDVQIGDIAKVVVPTNAAGEIWLHYSEQRANHFISAARVLDGTVGAEQFKGNIVLVGTSVPGLFDLRYDPWGELMPGVRAHAMALEQILTQQYLDRPAWSNMVEALLLAAGALIVGLYALRATARRSALLAAALLVLLLGGVWYAYRFEHLLLDGVNPALALLLSFGLTSAVHHFVTERERRWVRQAFSRYVSPNRVAHLMAHPDQLRLSGRRQVCSFVFTDLVGFTSLMERCDPAQVVSLLNEYLEGMLVIVFKREGTLERIMGDAVAVLFSAPVAQSDHRQRALDCALDMDVFASAYAQRLQAQGVPWGHTRIGVHSGEVIVGNFGGKTLFDYRALGDPINTAARLESVNKHLGTRMCVSQAIVEGCSGVPMRLVGRLVLKGKSQPLQAYEPLAASDPARCAAPADYAAALQLLQSGAAAPALAAFERLAASHPHDPLVALHLQRLRQGATDDLIVMSEK
ncbi:MAG: adenylate/guanylate cyclase domain-containing protein [Rhodoferax sp.]|uniref:CHASE2 domain-containing protein n=1 Tax=Rhodoferax sp. TaxID=50421 RepID=UPI00260CE134|nr:adenylate/guanylate cyclase domain-containing protein [Rhodoferax sp.]MDD5333286.1 adenylate/guanylate cyclase domain-containing protein [Rhodoferax sp.]